VCGPHQQARSGVKDVSGVGGKGMMLGVERMVVGGGGGVWLCQQHPQARRGVNDASRGGGLGAGGRMLGVDCVVGGGGSVWCQR